MIPHPTRKKAVELKRGTYLRVRKSFCRKVFPFIRLSGSSERYISAFTLPMTRRELRIGVRKSGPPLTQRWRSNKSWRGASVLNSPIVIRSEIIFIVGVWTKMASPFVMTTKMPIR